MMAAVVVAHIFGVSPVGNRVSQMRQPVWPPPGETSGLASLPAAEGGEEGARPAALAVTRLWRRLKACQPSVLGASHPFQHLFGAFHTGFE
jgi:hypothetical protein